MLSSEGGPGESLSLMYRNLLNNYEVVKDDFTMMRQRYEEVLSTHGAAVAKLEHSQVGHPSSFLLLTE